MPSPDEKINSFSDFWSYYQSQHQRLGTRFLHAAGTLVGVSVFSFALYLGNFWLGLGGITFGYSLAWVSHLCIEGNQPATWRYPMYSFLADLKMTGMVVVELASLDFLKKEP